MKNHPSRTSTQFIVGAAIIVLGILFLLDNLGIMDARYVIHLWPVLLIIIGVLKIIQSRSSSSWIIGAILVFLGTVWTLHRLDIIYYDLHHWWPVLLIIIGIGLLSKAWTGFHHSAILSGSRDSNNSESTVNLLAFMGGNHIKNVSKDFQGGEATAVMGGIEMDLRQASMNGEAVLNIFTFWGGIDIKVPTDWTVILKGVPLLGGFTDKTMPPPPDTPSKRFVIKGYTIMGGVEIKN
jgi:predicted membrane protein